MDSCGAAEKPWRQNQREILKDFEQVRDLPRAAGKVREEVLTEALEQVDAPAGRQPQFISIRNQVNELLAKEQVSPEEIEALQINLSEVADNLRSESERREYERLNEKLDIIYRYSKSISEIEDDYSSVVKRMNENFERVDKRMEKVSFWRNVMSGGFAVSFLANLVTFLGIMIKMPGAKLDRQLKRLEIAEKKARLKKEGIEVRDYS
jgi:hypothetical protein